MSIVALISAYGFAMAFGWVLPQSPEGKWKLPFLLAAGWAMSAYFWGKLS